MAERNSAADSAREQCASCDEIRPHNVCIKLLTESERDTNQKFSREPYRIAECHTCGTTTKLRLNDA